LKGARGRERKKKIHFNVLHLLFSFMAIETEVFFTRPLFIGQLLEIDVIS
jgi:hypothetical protein